MRLMRADAAMSCFTHIIVSFLGIIYFFGIYSQKWMKGCEHLFVYLLMCTAKISSKSIEIKCSAPRPMCEATSFSAAPLAVPSFTLRVSNSA